MPEVKIFVIYKLKNQKMINLGKKPKFIRLFINLNADLYQ